MCFLSPQSYSVNWGQNQGKGHFLFKLWGLFWILIHWIVMYTTFHLSPCNPVFYIFFSLTSYLPFLFHSILKSPLWSSCRSPTILSILLLFSVHVQTISVWRLSLYLPTHLTWAVPLMHSFLTWSILVTPKENLWEPRTQPNRANIL